VTSIPQPELLGFSPTEGTEGTRVVLQGQNLYFQHILAVRFNGTSAVIVGEFGPDTGQRLIAYVPENATTGPIVVETKWPTTSVSSFVVFCRLRRLSEFSPAFGARGSG
jgi:hypothetical protein